MSNIFSTIFGGGNNNTAQPAATAAPAGPASMPAPSAAGTANNPHLPASTQQQAGEGANNSQTPASPVADFANLWQNDDTNKGGAAPAPLFDLDPAKLEATIKAADFARTVPADVLQKAMSGDAAAMQLALNSVAQTAFQHQMVVTTKLIESAINKRDAGLMERIPGVVRQSRVSEELGSEAVFTNPATKPVLDMLTAQLQAKHPMATPQQIAEQAKKYLVGFAQLANPQTQQVSASNRRSFGDEDFSDMLQ